MGKIETDHAGSGGGITLSSDGTSLLLDGTAIGGGGGGADLYAANEVTPTAQPSATGTNAVAIGEAAVASGVDTFALGGVASGLKSIALSDFSVASGDYSVSIGAGSSALGSKSIGIVGDALYEYTTAIGSNSGSSASIAGITTSSSGGATALGGSYASGVDSFAAAIASNSASYGATGSNSIAIGNEARATKGGSVAIGTTAMASGTLSTALGVGADATAIYSVAIGRESDATAARAFSIGYGSTANQTDSYAFGRNAVAGVVNQIAIGGPTNTVLISGAYTLPIADGTANQVLTTDGAGAVTFATAGGGGGGAITYISTQTVTGATAQIEFDLSSSSYASYIIKAYDCAFTAAPTNTSCVDFTFYDGAYDSASVGTNRMSIRHQNGKEFTSTINTSSPWAYNLTLDAGSAQTTATKFGFIADIGGKTNSPIKVDAMFAIGSSTSSAPRLRGIAPNTTNNMHYMLVKPSSTTFAAGKFILYGIKDS